MKASFLLRCLSSTALATIVAVPAAFADGPTGERLVSGTATVSRPDGRSTVIDQSTSQAIIDWRRFGISEDHAVTFNQPGRDAVILNRVTGGEPSSILGSMSANGTVMLVNPDGILFGPQARIDVGGLVATTHDITNEDFLARRYMFGISGNPSASIVNEGNISVKDAGVAAFVAPGVRNSGVISARLGKVGLAAGNGFTLDLYGDELIKLRVDDEIISQVIDLATGQPVTALVDNQGTISADGGSVALTAATARLAVDRVINNDGVIEARTVESRNGRIVLGAQTTATKTQQSPPQTVRVSGRMDASGRDSGQTGGNIRILGEVLGLTRAQIDASGNAGGGVVLIGGDTMGGNPDEALLARYGIPTSSETVPTAHSLHIDGTTTITASAISGGNGGKIIAWSDDTTDVQGALRARGGAASGDGGFIETSGVNALRFAEMDVDASAPHGRGGLLLLDPEYSVIGRGEANVLQAGLNRGENVVNRANTITVAADILKTSGGDATLELLGNDGVTINNGVTIGSSSGRLNLHIDADADRNLPQGELADSFTELNNQNNRAFRRNLTIRADIFGWTELSQLQNYANNAWPLTGSTSLADYVDRSIDPDDPNMSLEGYEEYLSSRFIDLGGTYLLDGGTMRVSENTGVLSGTRGPIDIAITDRNASGVITGVEVDPWAYDFTVTPDITIARAYNSQLPGAQFIDLTPTDLRQIPTNYSPGGFNALLGLAAANQDASEVLRLSRQTGYVVATAEGLIAVSEAEGLELARRRAEELSTPRDTTRGNFSASLLSHWSTTLSDISKQDRGAARVIRYGVPALLDAYIARYQKYVPHKFKQYSKLLSNMLKLASMDERTIKSVRKEIQKNPTGTVASAAYIVFAEATTAAILTPIRLTGVALDAAGSVTGLEHLKKGGEAAYNTVNFYNDGIILTAKRIKSIWANQ